MNFLEFPAQLCVRPQTPENMQRYLDGRVSYYSGIINAGLNMPYASTGTPVSTLHGGPVITSMLNNIGIAADNSGMQGGLETLLMAAYYLGAQQATYFYLNNWQ